MFTALAAELAAERITDEELTELEALHAAMRQRHEAAELDAYFELNREIHNRIVAAARNPDLTRVRTGLSFQVERARFLSVATSSHRDKSMEDHERVMDALRRRDPSAARAAWQTHLERAGNETCRLVALWQQQSDAAAE